LGLEIIQLYTPKKEETYQERPWYDIFINDFREHGNVRLACEIAGITRDTAYKARERDLEFSRRWREAEEDSVDYLEAQARARALGFAGKEPSDTLLIFLLKAHRPEKYRERHDIIVRSAKVDKPVSEMSDEELAEYERSLRDKP
jgi:hypothetical protein